MYFDLMALCVLGALVWFWLDSLTVGEKATQRVRSACREAGLLLLDDKAAIRSVSLARNSAGVWVLRRVYTFEYSNNGDNRLQGSIHFDGVHMTLLDVGVLHVN